MTTSTQRYLDLVARSLIDAGGTGSDYSVARALRISKQAVSRYRQGHGGFDEDVARRVAEFLGVPVEQVLVDVALERARTPEGRAAWARLARRLADLAGVALVAILATSGSPGTAQAGTLPVGPDGGASIHYAHWLRRLFRWLVAAVDDLADAVA